MSKPNSWLPPAGTLAGESLLDGGASLLLFAPEKAAGAGSGHTKIGAGQKPQPYDAHGRYTGPKGGRIPIDGGPVRLFVDDEPGAGDEDESGFEDSAAEDEPAGDATAEDKAGEGEVVIAEEGEDSTPTVEQASHEEGGLSGGPVVRGPVTPPEKAPAEVTWKNDEKGKPDPKPEELKSQTREAVEDLKKDNPALDSINVNSGKRDGAPDSTNAHVQGRAVDINEVNGARIKDVVGGSDPAAKERLRQQASAVEAWGRQNKDVEMVITPFGGFYRYPGGNGEDMRDATSEEIAAHWNHIHIQTRK